MYYSILGDGTGVGKSRELASVFWELYNKNETQKAVWISTSVELAKGASWELDYIGGLLEKKTNFFINGNARKLGREIGFGAQPKSKISITSAKEGVLFTPYSKLSSNTMVHDFIATKNYDGMASCNYMVY